MQKMRKIVTGAGTEQHIQSVIRSYLGKIILISTHPDKQKGFKKVDIDQLDQKKILKGLPSKLSGTIKVFHVLMKCGKNWRLL